MPPARPAAPDDDRGVWAGFRHHSRTFSFATRLLPREVQLPIATLYLYCRAVDAIADERVLDVGPAAALDALAAAEDALGRTLAGAPPDDPLWQRLARVHDAYPLPEGPLRELVAGARWDLEGRPVRTDADLLAYSELVGGSVGAMMLPFLCEADADPAALVADARALGVAMQITNILRDVGEDARTLGRVYLPADALARAGLDVGTADPAALAADPAYAAVCERLMGLAEDRFDRGLRAVDALAPRVQAGIRAAARAYREILNEVRAAGYDNLTRRAVVPLARKLRLVAGDDYAARRDALRAAARAAA